MAGRHLVRSAGVVLAATFAVVGVVFLVVPGGVLELFNRIGDLFGLPPSPTDAFTLYLALAVAYMYVVTVLAWMMAREPEVRAYPWILVQAKGASALVCFGLFVLQSSHFIYLANLVVDGGIAAFVWWIALRPAPRRSRLPLGEHDSRQSTATRPRRTGPAR